MADNLVRRAMRQSAFFRLTLSSPDPSHTGGCYAKVIKLSAEAEPTIYATTRRWGTVMENVVMDPHTRELDLDSDAITANTRCAPRASGRCSSHGHW